MEHLKENENLPENGVIIKTIVTSEMGAHIAKEYGVETINTLTGFKYIGERIKWFEETEKRLSYSAMRRAAVFADLCQG